MDPKTGGYIYYKCYDELYKSYETKRLILERTTEKDYNSLAKIIINKKVNYYYQRPILYLENIQKAYEYIFNHTINTINFTIKLKTDNSNNIPIGQIGFYYVYKNCDEIGIFYYIGEEYQKKGYATEASCPLIKHLFENLPLTNTLKIDFNINNNGSRKIALKIINDIKKSHPDYIFGELEPFVDKYTKKLPPFNGKIEYFFEGLDRKYNVTYPENFFNGVNYFEVLSNGYYVKKK